MRDKQNGSIHSNVSIVGLAASKLKDEQRSRSNLDLYPNSLTKKGDAANKQHHKSNEYILAVDSMDDRRMSLVNLETALTDKLKSAADMATQSYSIKKGSFLSQSL